MTRPATTNQRVFSVDLLRGVVMILMALDHTRDYFSNLRFPPEDLSRATPALFLTRWITHFCAPAFFLLAGVGASLMISGGRPRKQVSWFLLTRGLWLVVLEMTVFQFAWNFAIGFPLFLIVIWTLGWSMVVLAALIFLPRWAIATIAIAMIAGHNLLDGISPASLGSLGPLWNFLHVPGFVFGKALIGYLLIPWCGVMALAMSSAPSSNGNQRHGRNFSSVQELRWWSASSSCAISISTGTHRHGLLSEQPHSPSHHS
jgi:uncharacterized membrane protein